MQHSPPGSDHAANNGQPDPTNGLPKEPLTEEEIQRKKEESLKHHYAKRRYVAKEIIETERTYVRHLSDIVDVSTLHTP